MTRPSKWTLLWLAWLLAFAAIELTAALSRHPHPRTLSEHLWHWFPRRWRRALLIGLLGLLMWHLASGPQLAPFGPWNVAPAP